MNLHAMVTDPKQRIRLHTRMAIGWFVLTNITAALALYLGESPFVAWIVWMSGYANAGAHWAAREGAAPSAKETS